MRKYLISLLLVVFFAGVFSGMVMAQDDELTVWIGGHVVAQEETWEEIITTFEEENNVEVNYQLIGFDVYFDRLTTAFRAEQGPDVTFADLGGWVPTFASNDWIVPIDDRLEDWEGTDQIWENLWPTVEYNGNRYGVPWYTDARLLLYNKRMFREAGLDPDNPPETWDELLETAQTLTDSSKRTYGYGVSGKMTEVTTLGYIMFLFGNDGQLLTDDYSRAAFNTEAGLEALEFYTDLYKEYEVSPENTLAYGEDDYRNMMAQDRVAMAVGGPWSFPLIEQANPNIKGEYSVSVHPYAEDAGPASVFGGWASVISSTAEDKDLAWKFIEYATSYDVWMNWIDQHGGPLPARRDVAEDTPVFEGDERWETILDVFPEAGFRPPIPEYPEVSNVIQSMVQDTLLGEKTAEEAINDAEEEVNEILNN